MLSPPTPQLFIWMNFLYNQWHISLRRRRAELEYPAGQARRAVGPQPNGRRASRALGWGSLCGPTALGDNCLTVGPSQ